MNPDHIDFIAQWGIQSLNALSVSLKDLDDATLRDVWAAASNFVTDAIVEERRRGIDFDTMEAT
jgi:hypothetical protein